MRTARSASKPLDGGGQFRGATAIAPPASKACRSARTTSMVLLRRPEGGDSRDIVGQWRGAGGAGCEDPFTYWLSTSKLPECFLNFCRRVLFA